MKKETEDKVNPEIDFDLVAFMADIENWGKQYQDIRKNRKILQEWHTVTTKRMPNPMFNKFSGNGNGAKVIIPGIDMTQEMIDVPVISSVIFVQKEKKKDAILPG